MFSFWFKKLFSPFFSENSSSSKDTCCGAVGQWAAQTWHCSPQTQVFTFRNSRSTSIFRWMHWCQSCSQSQRPVCSQNPLCPPPQFKSWPVDRPWTDRCSCRFVFNHEHDVIRKLTNQGGGTCTDITSCCHWQMTEAPGSGSHDWIQVRHRFHCLLKTHTHSLL